MSDSLAALSEHKWVIASLKGHCHGKTSSMSPVQIISPVGHAHELTGPLKNLGSELEPHPVTAFPVAPLLPHTYQGQLSIPCNPPITHTWDS